LVYDSSKSELHLGV